MKQVDVVVGCERSYAWNIAYMVTRCVRLTARVKIPTSDRSGYITEPTVQIQFYAFTRKGLRKRIRRRAMDFCPAPSIRFFEWRSAMDDRRQCPWNARYEKWEAWTIGNPVIRGPFY